jgi:hypothetical protein
MTMPGVVRRVGAWITYCRRRRSVRMRRFAVVGHGAIYHEEQDCPHAHERVNFFPGVDLPSARWANSADRVSAASGAGDGLADVASAGVAGVDLSPIAAAGWNRSPTFEALDHWS